ncbi:uncharacterized protein [Amphiura filiformis]|uniref:uncharacterized protein n=1 Tax=Amphiura filiformis TaxID=82378 RepID=UPI003B2153AE
MAASHVILMHVVLAFMCFVLSVKTAPQPTPAYPHVVTLEINNLMLYNIAVKDVQNPRSPEHAQSVLGKILDKHHMTLDQVDAPPILKTLVNKIKKMVTLVNQKRKAGGTSIKNLLDKWKCSLYNLKLPHATGSPTKRKLENDLNEEKCKRRKLETDFNNLQEEVEQRTEEQNELKRQVERLKNPIKRKRGQRGRSKNKEGYHQAQKYRLRRRSIAQIKETVEEMANDAGFTPVSLTMKDQDGKLIKIYFGDESVEEMTEEEIEEMLFILDSFNIPLKGYHEIAQRYDNLPRLGAVKKKKKALNGSCPLQHIDTQLGNLRLTGVVRSLNEALVSILSDPSKSHLLENGSVKIKLSGDGTRAARKSISSIFFHYSGEDSCKSWRAIIYLQ